MKDIIFYLTESEAFNTASYLGVALSELFRRKNEDDKTDNEKRITQAKIDTVTKLQNAFETHRSPNFKETETP